MEESTGAVSVAEQMRELAEQATIMARDLHGITLDYSEASVEHVEAILDSLHHQNRPGPLGWLSRRGGARLDERKLYGVALMYGAYLGEVMRRHWGGTWVEDLPEDQPWYTIQFGTTSLFPINKAHKRLVNGEEDHVGVFFSRAREHAEDGLRGDKQTFTPIG